MLNLARRTLNRVPSFQDILQGKMGGQDMFVTALSPLALANLLMECSSVDVLVIGAGPTGLGAAKRLNQLVLPFTQLESMAKLL